MSFTDWLSVLPIRVDNPYELYGLSIRKSYMDFESKQLTHTPIFNEIKEERHLMAKMLRWWRRLAKWRQQTQTVVAA